MTDKEIILKAQLDVLKSWFTIRARDDKLTESQRFEAGSYVKQIRESVELADITVEHTDDGEELPLSSHREKEIRHHMDDIVMNLMEIREKTDEIYRKYRMVNSHLDSCKDDKEIAELREECRLREAKKG